MTAEMKSPMEKLLEHLVDGIFEQPPPNVTDYGIPFWITPTIADEPIIVDTARVDSDAT